MSKLSMLDRFPNELFYEVFEYLTTYNILYAFKGLNKRIDTLLANYTLYDLNFLSWPKSKFDFVCQSIGPEQVRSLILSDGDDTCRQIHLFFGLFYIRHFINLESLTLLEITENDLNKIITKFNLLPKLSCLSINLTHDLIPKLIVPSLKYLSINTCSMIQLQQLLLSTPLLTNLNIQLIADTASANDTFLPATITTEIYQLKIKLAKNSNITFNDIKVLFLWMPKLKKFTFIAAKGINFIHGDQWEHLIHTYLAHLKEFHFTIHPYLDHHMNIEQVLATFQTPFWLKEKQWLIHCNHHHFPNSRLRNLLNVHLYSLPYSDEQFDLTLSTKTITNGSKDEYSTVKNLNFLIDCRDDPVIAERYYFPNLDSLTIGNLHRLMPIDHFINLSQIQHLTIKQNNPIHSKEFLSYILVHSTKLQSLELSWHTMVEITKNFTDQQVCSLLNKQIRSLNVLNMIPDNEADDGKSINLLNQLFSTNLEKLSLSVTSMNNILVVLNQMLKLYSIKIEYNSSNTTMNNEELSLWLMRNVPRLKNFTYKIRSATETRACLLLWIGH